VKYFAYGSNMDINDLLQWCETRKLSLSQFELTGTAYIEGFKLSFNHYSKERKGGVANIISQHDTDNSSIRTYGLLFEIDNQTRNIIRKKEGYPQDYGEIELCVHLANGTTVKAITYKVQKKMETVSEKKPTGYYLGLILSNARKNHFPQAYISFLENIETQVK